MGRIKHAHHRGSYHRDSIKIRATANANPNTTCWRCGLRLNQHTPHKNGKPAYWTAGHINDGQVNGPLAPEASTCNYTAGNRHRHDPANTLTPTRNR